MNSALRIVLYVLAGFATDTVASDSRPNVLFIAIDDMNNYALGLNRDGRAQTPQMDRLAKRGILFTNAHCAAPACNPSRVSVMTGIAPSTSGVYLNRQDWRQCSRLNHRTTIPRHFRDHGYRVLGGGKLYHAANLSVAGLGGFLDPSPWHAFFPSKSRQLPDEYVPPKQAIHGSNRFYGGRFDWNPLDMDDNHMGDGKVVAWAEKQLAIAHDDPLFLAVGIYKPHIPWYTPRKWFDQYPSSTLPPSVNHAADLDDIPDAGIAMSKGEWHRWLVEHDKRDDAVQAYLASLSFADSMVGRLIDALDSGPMAGNTIVVLWSDHGYHLGEKQHWEKRVLWEQATQVPMIIVDRRVGNAGVRCDRPVSLLDLFPTLVDLCGLGSLDELDGVSLRPLYENPDAESSRHIVTTQGFNNHAVRSQNWRYIRYANGAEELYDHRADWAELRNLAEEPEYELVKQRLSASLPVSNSPPDPEIQ
ncbi:MAG: sulfatase [Planctomycetota bacterium]